MLPFLTFSDPIFIVSGLFEASQWNTMEWQFYSQDFLLVSHHSLYDLIICRRTIALHQKFGFPFFLEHWYAVFPHLSHSCGSWGYPCDWVWANRTSEEVMHVNPRLEMQKIQHAIFHVLFLPCDHPKQAWQPSIGYGRIGISLCLWMTSWGPLSILQPHWLLYKCKATEFLSICHSH